MMEMPREASGHGVELVLDHDVDVISVETLPHESDGVQPWCSIRFGKDLPTLQLVDLVWEM